MKNMKRAKRRKLNILKFKKIYNRYKRELTQYTQDDIKFHAIKTFNNAKSCSCFMCGNPIHFNKGIYVFTHQELIFNINATEQLNEYHTDINTYIVT